MDPKSEFENASEEMMNLWNDVKATIANIDVDVTECAKGNSAAGSRVRKVLRPLRKTFGTLTKATMNVSKLASAARKAAKAAAKSQG
jgi:hypothetical protein